MKSEIVDIDVQVHRWTERAVLVSDDGDSEKAEWIPLSQCELVQKKGSIYTMTLSESLAKEKGLI